MQGKIAQKKGKTAGIKKKSAPKGKAKKTVRGRMKAEES